MFVLPQSIVKLIVAKEINHSDLSFNPINEHKKSLAWANQAAINSELLSSINPYCMATQQPCKMDECELYREINGKNQWICLEWQLFFPEISLDQQFLLPCVGIREMDHRLTAEYIENYLKPMRANYYCKKCYRVYENKPIRHLEDDHLEHDQPICSCGYEIFDDIQELIHTNNTVVIPVM